jgi:hypothetical protein
MHPRHSRRPAALGTIGKTEKSISGGADAEQAKQKPQLAPPHLNLLVRGSY